MGNERRSNHLGLSGDVNRDPRMKVAQRAGAFVRRSSDEVRVAVSYARVESSTSLLLLRFAV